MEERIPITKEGLEKIKSELLTLVSKERPAVQRAIATAREHGDLRENAEYHAAKEQQGFIEGRIQEINARMPKYQVVDPSMQQTEKVVFGARVTVENLESGETLSYQIVGPDVVSPDSRDFTFLCGSTPRRLRRVFLVSEYSEIEITDGT